MTLRKRNKSAIQFWEQVFSNLAKQEDAALWDPNYDSTEDEKKLREGLKTAGWTEGDIKARIDMHRATISNAPVTSPGVNPYVEVQFDKLCNDIEAAMERLNLSSHAGVARGIEPRLGPYAAKTNVIMTDESIITVGSHLFRFCGLVARAYTRTFYLNPYLWGAADYESKLARDCLRGSPEVIKYWIRIYLSYALTGTHIMVPFQPANQTELLLFEQVARAMEIFAIAHEYGHHSLNHGRQVGDEAHWEEFEADQFALRICYEVERLPVIFDNPYLSSGAGGVLLLLALDTLRGVEDIVSGAKAKGLDTHPPAISRIEGFESVAVLRPDEFTALKTFRTACVRIMALVEAELLPALREISSQIPRSILPAEFRAG